MSKRKLGILISCRPGAQKFKHGIGIAKAAVKIGVDVYLYLLFDAVTAVDSEEVQELKKSGVKLYVCAYESLKRKIKPGDSAIYSGLGSLADIIACADRFVAFN